MIKTKEQLKQVLRQDFVYYHRNGRAKRLYDILLSRENTCIWRYVKTMRYCDYYATNKRKSIWHAFMYWWYSRKHNRQGVKLGLIIGSGAFDAGLCLYHTGNIVVNGYSRIGKNCRLHGSNCIGNSRGGTIVLLLATMYASVLERKCLEKSTSRTMLQSPQVRW